VDLLEVAHLPRGRLAAAALVACALFPTTAGAQSGTTIPRVAFEYARLLERIEHSARPAPIESLYELGFAVGDSLLSPGPVGEPITTMDDSTFARTGRLVRGFDLLRDEVEGVLPDFDFFSDLASRRGDSVDVAFFRGMKATMGKRVMPVYVQQQTDYSGCTRFGSGALVADYDRWQGFPTSGRFARRAHETLGDVASALLEGECACGDRSSVVKELRLFLERHPRGFMSDRVRARLRDVESGKAKIREHCTPG
jgi:hypothetical protein